VSAPRIPIFQRTRIVRPGDCDVLGHVNNVAWVGFVVDLATAHSEALGLGFDATRAHGGGWIVRRHEILYRRDARPGDEIAESTWVSTMRGARSLRHARFRDADGRELVAATTEWAFVDLEAGRPRRIPKPVLGRFDPVEPAPDV